MYFLLNLYTAVIMPDIEVITKKLRQVFLNEKVKKKFNQKGVIDKYIRTTKTYNKNTQHKTELVSFYLLKMLKKTKKKSLFRMLILKIFEN